MMDVCDNEYMYAVSFLKIAHKLTLNTNSHKELSAMLMMNRYQYFSFLGK